MEHGELIIEVGGGADPDELDLVVEQLRAEIEESGVPEPHRGEIVQELPSGVRSDALTYTSEILVALSAVGGAIGGINAIVQTVDAWRKRRSDPPRVVVRIGDVEVVINGVGGVDGGDVERLGEAAAGARRTPLEDGANHAG